MSRAANIIEHVPADGVRVLEAPHGKRFVLPWRELSGHRVIGFVLLGAALVMLGLFGGFMLSWFGGLLGGRASGGSGAATGGAVMLIFSLVIIVPFAVMLLLELSIAFAIIFNRSRCEVRLDEKHLRLIEHFGPLRWKFKRPRVAVRSLTVGVPGEGATGFGKGLPGGAVVATGDFPRPLLIALAYPPEVLRALAEALSEHLGGAVGVREETVTSLSSLDEAGSGVPAGAPLAQPPTSTATVTRGDGELSIAIPVAGFRGGAKGLLGFAIIWLVFIAIFTAVWVPAWWSAGGNDRWIALFVVPFWLIGIGLLVVALNLARRRAILDVVGDTLLISRQNLFGIRQEQLTRDEISDIRVGASGMEVNDRPLMQLQVDRRSGGRIGLLTNRDTDELAWIAAELRAALGVGR